MGAGMRLARTWALAVSVWVSGCTGITGSPTDPQDPDATDAGANRDAGAGDAGSGSDAGAVTDAGRVTYCEVGPAIAATCGGCHGASAAVPLASMAQLAHASALGGTMLDRALTRMTALPLSSAMPPNVGGSSELVSLLSRWREGGLAPCGGDVSDAGTTPPPPMFECDAGAPISSAPLLRLTVQQYRNALTQVLSGGLTAVEVRAALTAVAPRLDALPSDGLASGEHLTYDTEDQRISRLLVDPQVYAALDLGDWLVADTARLERFVKAFAGAANCPTVASASCVSAFIGSFGKAALRRPVDADEKVVFQGFYDDAAFGGYAATIAGILVSPSFLFRTEFKGEAVAGQSDLLTLTDWELASRLAFSLTGSPPDAPLLAAAEAHFVGTGKTFEDQTTRLVASTKGKQHLERFYTQWLRSDRVPPIDSSAVPALVRSYPDRPDSGLPASTDLEALRNDAFAELVTLMTEVTNADGTLKDALLSERSYAHSKDLAAIYGVTPWPGTLPDGGVDSSPVTFPAGQRAGLFSRAGFLLSGFADANPIKRGARLRVEYLCDLMVPPDNTTPPAEYVTPAVPTPRHVAKAKTEIEGSTCVSCHKPFINPLGFALEQYDAFGRFRTQEPVQVGATFNWVPSEWWSVPNVTPNDPEAHSSKDLAVILAESQKFNACFARHVFRYLNARAGAVTTTTDGCLLRDLQATASGSPLRRTFTSSTQQPAFRLRRLTREN